MGGFKKVSQEAAEYLNKTYRRKFSCDADDALQEAWIHLVVVRGMKINEISTGLLFKTAVDKYRDILRKKFRQGKVESTV